MKRRNWAHKPTIRDIARKAGVSTTTVINVMKDRASEVSPPMSRRIKKIAAKIGYVKNLTAASLSTRRSHVIAAVISGAFHHEPKLHGIEINPFYGEFVFRLEHEARARGYSISLFAGNEEDALSFLLERQYDAVLVLGVTGTYLPNRIAKHHLPQILFDSYVERKEFTRVCGNEALGGALAAQHLIERGRRKLAFVGDVRLDLSTLIPTIRYKGALKACRKAGVSLASFPVSTSFEGGASAAEQIIAQGFNGVITGADVVAAGLVQGLRHARISVPGKVSVVGYDNLLVSRACLPALTTIDQRLDDKIRAALDLVENPQRRKVVVIPPTLVIRDST